jgi:alginate O-acetyltransferase complex protein AlgI
MIELFEYGIGVLAVWLVAMRLRSTTARQALYLVASWIFYFSWGTWLIVVLIFSSLMNYALGEWLKKKITVGRLWTGILFNLALLSVFKYLPLLGNVAPSGSPLSLLKRMIFPLGISFWTFQALSYLLELYREEELDPTLLEFCLYMSFWPTVLAGADLPDVEHAAAIPAGLGCQRRRSEYGSAPRRDWRHDVGSRQRHGRRSYEGAGVDAIFKTAFSPSGATHLGGLDVWLLIIAYGFQLYFSFCGWTHIMIGAARLFGIQLHENFNRPYLSTTISTFWTRWHMSLSFWIRDFLFLPLATARREVWWRNLSLVIAMFVFGVWHISAGHEGSVLLLFWGTYHGILLVLHRQWQEFRKRVGFEWTGALATGISWH